MRQAFSLVELSIVLVILGLLTGGILAGQSLIRAAELRAVTTEFNKYVAATQSFRDKYFAIPGDMTNATSFWGVLDPTAATCKTTAATGLPTCNGDGNGLADSSTASVEYFRFWQHLANAGLIEGTYTGITGAGYVGGSNVPASKLSQNMWLASSQATSAAASTLTYAVDPQNGFATLAQGFAFTTAGSLGLKPEEAWNIDTKLDDGMPGSGRLVPYKGNGTNTSCTTAAGSVADAGSTYLLTNSSKDCALMFRRAF